MATLSVVWRPKSGQRGEAVWMQTSGTPLVGVERCSLLRMWTSAEGSRSAHRLLYLSAVRGDWREHEDRRHRLASTLSSLRG
jgi:hypothetical protein